MEVCWILREEVKFPVCRVLADTPVCPLVASNSLFFCLVSVGFVSQFSCDVGKLIGVS